MLQELIIAVWLRVELVKMAIEVAENIVRILEEMVTNNFLSKICRLVFIKCGVMYLCRQHKKMVTDSSK
jgi:hypothetical protein